MVSCTVLMSTYNGQEFIRTQIDSILNQENVKVSLIVRDDGSSDDTISILKEYETNGRLKWYTGNNLKPAGSFMDLINHIDIEDEFYAFSDQDDYWLPDKLSTAIEAIGYSSQPVLYYGAYKLVDKELNEIGSAKAKKPVVSLNIKKAVIYSNCTGCTVCFNKAMLLMLRKHRAEFQIMHDNWAHKLCVAVGGKLIYDKTPHILYRQHGNNVIGGSSKLLGRVKRHLNTMFNNPCYRSRSIIELYRLYSDEMPADTKNVCKLVAEYHKGVNRWKIVFDRGFRTGDRRIDMIFIGAMILGVF